MIDAFAVARKIRDNLYLDLFFINEALNNTPKDYKFDKSLLEMDKQELIKEMLSYASSVLESEEKNDNIQTINLWLNNNYSSKDRKIPFFSFSNYKHSIEGKCNELKECHEKYLDEIFKKTNDTLNNYVHSNGPSFISNAIIDSNKGYYLKAAKDLLELLNTIKRLFLIDLYFIDSTLFQADDYLDALEFGLEPEEGSQYRAIYQVIEEFRLIRKEDPKLYFFLKNNNRFYMECFDKE